MRHLNTPQVKSISDFLNKVSAAWFTSAAITPFLQTNTTIDKVLLGLVGLMMAAFFLWGSVVILKGVGA
ncbi:MAG TPA: hypothetical protein VKC54_04125 [Patescibacteria group bacterium]|nr:hypothetical protein [Patescibacteria group bacterium]